MSQKKFTVDDLQPWVDMLCDAIENTGASSSGYDHGAYACAYMYRDLLQKVREGKFSEDALKGHLYNFRSWMFKLSDPRQQYRLKHLADALDTYITREWQNNIRTPKDLTEWLNAADLTDALKPPRQLY